MSSRMNKYFEEPENLVTRTTRHQDLYKDINKSELENYSIQSNATVLGENKNEIDVEKIKKILDTKYNEVPKRKTIHIEDEPEEIIEREDTKEYDIKAILEKAKEEKVVSYEEDRLKKLRDTQFDILKNLNTNESPKEENESNTLEELINTISINELNNKKTNSDTEPDLFDDLLGGNTEIHNFEETTDNNIISEEKEETEEDNNLENSMYTKSNAIVNKDFEDVEEGMNIIAKIIIAIIVVAFIAGVIIILKPILFN